MKFEATQYELLREVYEGESGAEWQAFMAKRESEGWKLYYAKVTKQLGGDRFRGNVEWRKEKVTP